MTSGLNALMVYNPEFIVASVYAVAAGLKEIARAKNGIKSERSIAIGCILILAAGSFIKTHLKPYEEPDNSKKEEDEEE